MRRTLTIARLTFHEALRKRILLAALLLGLLFLLVYGVGFRLIEQDVGRARGGPSLLELNEIRNFLLLAGLYVVNFLTTMMTVLTSVDTLSGEIQSGTIQTLLAKPLRRRELLLGKWLGFAGMLTLYLLLMAGGVMAIGYALSGYVVPQAWVGLGLLLLNILLLLGLSLLGGTSLSTLANGVLVFGLFGVAFVGGWIEQFGALLDNQTAINLGVLSSLIMPTEALWRRAAFEMQSPLVSAIGFSPFFSTSVPSPMMIGYTVLYLLAALGLALYLFGRRDL